MASPGFVVQFAGGGDADEVDVVRAGECHGPRVSHGIVDFGKTVRGGDRKGAGRIQRDVHIGGAFIEPDADLSAMSAQVDGLRVVVMATRPQAGLSIPVSIMGTPVGFFAVEKEQHKGHKGTKVTKKYSSGLVNPTFCAVPTALYYTGDMLSSTEVLGYIFTVPTGPEDKSRRYGANGNSLFMILGLALDLHGRAFVHTADVGFLFFTD